MVRQLLAVAVCGVLAACVAHDNAGGDDDDGGAGADAARDGGAASPDAATTASCAPLPGVAYASLSTAGAPSDRPAAQHADLNVALRGFTPTGGALALIELGGDTDTLAPRFQGLFADGRVPAFVANYRVNQWDWASNTAGGPITDWEVTMLGVATTPGEPLTLPTSGYDIGDAYQARVLYVDDDSVTLKYTREDNVVGGYTMHLVGVCVAPELRAVYQADDAAGRAQLPALAAGQAFGRAAGAELRLTIRDTGAFMDPRSRKDWW